MNAPDYDGFWKALPEAAQYRDEWDINEGFRHRYREEIMGALNMLRRLGLVWGATALHPQPPEECDLCQVTLAHRQMFVDGATNDSRWAVMCPKCFIEEGLAIGPLTGQLYLQVAPGKWRLVVGSDADGEDQTTLSLPKPLKVRLTSRIFRWLCSSPKRQAEARESEAHHRTHCGTPAIWMGAKIETNKSGPGYVSPRVKPSRRPTQFKRG